MNASKYLFLTLLILLNFNYVKSAVAQDEVVVDKTTITNLIKKSPASGSVKDKLLGVLNSSSTVSGEDIALIKRDLSDDMIASTAETSSASFLAEGLLIVFIFKNKNDVRKIEELQEFFDLSRKWKIYNLATVFAGDSVGKTSTRLAKNVLEDKNFYLDMCSDRKQGMVRECFYFILANKGESSYLQSIIRTKVCSSTLLYSLIGSLVNAEYPNIEATVEWYFLERAMQEEELKMCLDYLAKVKNVGEITSLKSLKAFQIEQAVSSAKSLGIKTNISSPDDRNEESSFTISKIPSSYNESAIQKAQEAPGFAVRDMNGMERNLLSLKGKSNLVLTFFPKCFTGGCTNHLSSLRDVYPEIQANDTVLWAVSIDAADGEQGQKAFAKKWNLPFPLLPDTERKLSLLYGAARVKTDLSSRQTVFINKEGVIEYIDRKVDVNKHGVDVIEKMRELGWIK